MSESPSDFPSDDSIPSRLHQRVAIYDPSDEWEDDDDDMDFEAAEESADGALGESDLDEIEYFGARTYSREFQFVQIHITELILDNQTPPRTMAVG